MILWGGTYYFSRPDPETLIELRVASRVVSHSSGHGWLVLELRGYNTFKFATYPDFEIHKKAGSLLDFIQDGDSVQKLIRSDSISVIRNGERYTWRISY